jgi:uncharacterized protein
MFEAANDVKLRLTGLNNMKADTDAENTPITTIDLDVTNNCTIQCDYCYRGEKNKQSISWEVGVRAIDFLIQHSQGQQELSVALFGGEPLLEFGFIKKLVPYAQRKASYYGKRIHFRATTNCVLVNDEIIEFFRQHRMSFHTSIDGGPESHDKHRHFPDGTGTSAIIEPKIRKILKYWPNTAARMTFCNDTVHRWFDDVLYLVELGYTNLPMVPAAECNWTEEQWGNMKRELRKISDLYIETFRVGHPIYIKHIEDSLKGIVNPSRRKQHCGAGRGYLSVRTDGTIYPCSRFGDSSDGRSGDQWQLGSVFAGIDQERRRTFLNFDCASQTEADCENCLAANMCSIPCIALNWFCFGDIYKPHPNQCKFRRMCFAEALRIHYILESEKNRLFMKRFYPEIQQGRSSSRSQNTGQKNSSVTSQSKSAMRSRYSR